MIVVDASAILEILSGSPAGARLDLVIGDEPVHAPHLIDVEVANVIRRWERVGAIPKGQGALRLKVFRAMTVIRYEHEPLLDDIWALRHNLTAYDAAYLVLSRRLGADLLTMDSGLQRLTTRP